MPDYCRIIPCLDVKDGRVVKGVHFVDLVDAADPVEAAAAYDESGADAITFFDITATVENRATTLDLVRRVCEAISVPLIVGGGISTTADIQALFDSGVSACTVNTAAIKRPALITEAADRFGSDKIIVAIDARRNPGVASGYGVVTYGGTRTMDLDAFKWAAQCADLGAGKILTTSMETDGAKNGYDIPLTLGCGFASELPVIASGGAGELEHFYQAATAGKAAALLAASVFHFGKFTVRQVKEYLADRGVKVRL